MSVRAGTIQGTQRGVSWSGAWIAAIMLTAILALSLLAVNRSGGALEKAPASPRLEMSTGGPGGPSTLTHPSTSVPGSFGVVVGGTVCHQCR